MWLRSKYFIRSAPEAHKKEAGTPGGIRRQSKEHHQDLTPVAFSLLCVGISSRLG